MHMSFSDKSELIRNGVNKRNIYHEEYKFEKGKVLYIALQLSGVDNRIKGVV